MSVDLSNSSIAQWFAEREQHRCGYCKNPSGSISYGMMTEELTVEDYKDLIDRGWRRSGKYCYKPTLDKTCCPQYTIRCDAIKFTLNKSHKKIIKKFNKFLNDGEFNKNVPPDQQEEEPSSEIPGYNKKSTINLSNAVTTEAGSSCQLQPELKKPVDVSYGQVYASDGAKDKEKLQNETSDTMIQSTETNKSIKKPLKDGAGPDPNKPPCKKAKLLRLERKQEKLKQKGVELQPSSKNNNAPKTLNEFLEEISPTARHKFKLKLIPTSICGDEWKQAEHVEHELYKKYQMIVHNDPPIKLTKGAFTRFLVNSPLKIVLERMTREHRTFSISAKLFQKYQMIVHKDSPSSCDPNEFCDFLVRTPLKPKPFPSNIEGPGYGSFHQQYWLDDKLIAVGVIDILPGCVSSVYFFYDPDYRDLTLGTYGSLREIQLVQSLYSKIPDLKYYYMGFYIHSCPKMRYKGNLHPSYLLCPETYVWVPIENCVGKLDSSKYSRFNSDTDAVDTSSCSSNDVNNIKVVYDYKLMYVKDYIRVFDGDMEVFENMANLIGRKSARSIIFWIAQ